MAEDLSKPVAGEDWKIPDIGIEFVWIKALNCWVGKYEVTNGEYRKFKPDHNSKSYNNLSLNRDRQPVVFIEYFDIIYYSQWLTDREQKAGRLPAGYIYRMPSRNEWTTFCRCGYKCKYPWGNSMPPKYGNYLGQEGFYHLTSIVGYNDGYRVSCLVEQSGGNTWGLYGVGGNVSEYTVASGADLSFDAMRGASWNDGMPEQLCSEYRFELGGRGDSPYEGFRLVLTQAE